MPDYSTVSCVEVHGSRTEGRSWKGGPRCQVQLECEYADRYQLSGDLLQNGVWPFSPGGDIPPRVQDVQMSYKETLYDTEGQGIIYKTAVLDVTYGYDESAGQQQGGGSPAGRQLYTENIEPWIEVISVRDHDWAWKSGPGATPDDYTELGERNIPTITTTGMSIVRTYYGWETVPLSFFDLQGKLNNAQVTMLGMDFSAETVLFTPKNLQRAISTTGTDGFNVQVAFKYRKDGWNKYPIPDPDGGLGAKAVEYYFRPKNSQNPWTKFIPYRTADISDWTF